jgi:hypothetical protein
MSRLDSFVLLNTCGLLQAKVALFKGYWVIDQQMICVIMKGSQSIVVFEKLKISEPSLKGRPKH